MITLQLGGANPTNKSDELFAKMLDLAERLLMQEILEETAMMCGDDFTTRFIGRFGLYETINGEMVAFQPKEELIFELICDDFIVVDELGMVKMVAYHVDDYELAIHG